MTSKKPQNKNRYDKNSIEAIRDLGGSVAKSVATDLGRDMVSDLWDQLLGVETGGNKHGDMQQGQEIDLVQMANRAKAEAGKHIEAAINWKDEIVNTEKRSMQDTTGEISVKVQEIVIELKKITASSKELQTQFKGVVAEQRISKPGKYHLTFFEFMLSMIRDARMKIESSGAWLSASKSKKSQKGYWNQFKKHGTSFGLSNERVVATQTG